MARRALYSGLIPAETLNGTEPYRVQFSYGVFSLAPKVTQSGRYWYAYKRADGKLYKTYVGKGGEVTAETLHQACLALSDKIRRATGKMHLQSNRSRGAH